MQSASIEKTCSGVRKSHPRATRPSRVLHNGSTPAGDVLDCIYASSSLCVGCFRYVHFENRFDPKYVGDHFKKG